MKLRERSAQIAKPARSNVTGLSQWKDEPFSRSSPKGGFAEGFVFNVNASGSMETHKTTAMYKRLGKWLLVMVGISLVVMFFINLIDQVLAGG
ncbi:MAG: hypothetical protein WCJ71_04935 [Candidatus Omnitrophota bacterium]